MPVQTGMPEAVVTRAARVIYLHGFASSARSTKAAFFGQQLAAAGVPFECPDFNEPDFRTMTLTRMLDRLGRELASGDRPAAAIGSSLGGTLAILAAAQFAERIDRLVLLAPAVMFAKPGHHLLPPERIAQWQHEGALPFYHHAYNGDRLLDFGFYEDSLTHDAFETRFTQPALVFQGLRDESVDHRTVEQFARTRPNVTLSLLDDDHQLVASLPRIWQGVAPFLGLL